MGILGYLDGQGVYIQNGHVALDGTLEQKFTLSNPTPAAGAVTLTAAQVKGGLITIDPSATDTTVTTPTAALLRTALTKRKAGSSFRCWIRNSGSTAGVFLTIAGGSSVTLSPTSIIVGPGETVELVFRCTNATAASAAFTCYLAGYSPASIGGLSGQVFGTATLADDAAAIPAADLINKVLTITPTAARSKATASAAALISLLPNPVAGGSFEFYIRNAATAGDFDLTLTAGATVTLSPTTITISPGDLVHFRAVLTSGTALTIHRLEDNEVSTPVFPIAVADSAAAIPAATLLSGVLTATLTADRSKATDTAANIIALLPVAQIGQSYEFVVRNASTAGNYSLTITAGANVTLDPTTMIVRPGQESRFLMVLTSTTALTIYRLESSMADLPVFPATIVDDAAALLVGDIVNGIATITPTADRSKATPAAVDIIAALPLAQIGQSHDFYVINAAADNFDLTITAGVGVTLSPTTIVIGPGEKSHFEVVLTAATTLTIYQLETDVIGLPVIPGTLADDAAAITAAEIGVGILTITPTADRSKATDTAANIIAALPQPQVGKTHDFWILNAAADDYDLTITAGVGVTLSPTSVVVKAGQRTHFMIVVTATTTVTIYRLEENIQESTAHVNYDNIAAAEAASAGTIVTVVNLANGAQAVAAQPDVPRNLVVRIVDTTPTLTAGTTTIVGVGVDGEAVTEVFAWPGGGSPYTITGNKIFARVTSVTTADYATLGGAGDETFEVCQGLKIGLPSRPGGILTGVHKACVDGADEAVGTVSTANRSIISTTAPNGTRDFDFWYTYV